MKKIGFLMMCLVLFSSSMVFAGGGKGGGDGKSTLELTQVTTESGSEEVQPEDVLTLEFSNNVVNMSVKENNMTCFSVVDSQGNPVEIEVIMGDDQVDRSIKRLVHIKPVTTWKAGEKHLVTVTKDLSGKNGVLLGKDVTYEFTVASPAAQASGSKMWMIGFAAIIVLAGGFAFAKK